jgi:hypothetical protein
LSFQIDDDGAIGSAFLEGPVINTDDPRIGRAMGITLSDTTQNGIATDFDLEAMEDTTSCRASDFKPDLANEGG